MSRRASRELAMKLLYQLEIQKGNREEQIRDALNESKLDKNDKDYITDIINGVYNNTEQIDSIIESQLKGWKLSRISRIDLSILRLSIYEICYRNDIPFSVSVNEAVELAKKYSGTESASFINGILGKVIKSKSGDNRS